MKKKHVKIIAGAIAILLAVVMILPFILDAVFYSGMVGASASSRVNTLNNKLDNLAEEKKEIQKEINRIKGEKKTVQQKKNALDKQISVTKEEISTANSLISALNDQINQFNTELNEIQAKEEQQYEAYKLRIRVMEEEGSISYLSVLLSADSFSDLLSKVEIIQNVMTHDQGLMDRLEQTRVQVEEKKKQIQASKAEQEAAKAVLESKKTELAAKSSEVGEVIDELSDEQAKYQKEFNEAEAAMKSAKAELKKLLNTSSTSQTKYVGGTFMWPTPSCTIITSAYGMRYDPITRVRSKHTGVDIGAKMGSNIVAANSGTVVTSGWSSKGYGNYVVINHGGGMSTLYAHMSKRLVSKGQTVSKGDVIGKVGSTGYSTGPHLHFEILKNGDDTNPMNYFTKG